MSEEKERADQARKQAEASRREQEAAASRREQETAERLLVPNGRNIKQARLARKWEITDLAKAAKCSDKTVNNLEAGKKCYESTLIRFAKALDVEVMSINSSYSWPPKEESHNRTQCRFTHFATFDDFDESEDLINLISKLKQAIGAKHPVVVIVVARSSIDITIELDNADLFRLLAAMADNSLKDLNIASFQVIDDTWLPMIAKLIVYLTGDWRWANFAYMLDQTFGASPPIKPLPSSQPPRPSESAPSPSAAPQARPARPR